MQVGFFPATIICPITITLAVKFNDSRCEAGNSRIYQLVSRKIHEKIFQFEAVFRKSSRWSWTLCETEGRRRCQPWQTTFLFSDHSFFYANPFFRNHFFFFQLLYSFHSWNRRPTLYYVFSQPLMCYHWNVIILTPLIALDSLQIIISLLLWNSTQIIKD